MKRIFTFSCLAVSITAHAMHNNPVPQLPSRPQQTLSNIAYSPSINDLRRAFLGIGNEYHPESGKPEFKQVTEATQLQTTSNAAAYAQCTILGFMQNINQSKLKKSTL